MPLKKIPNPRVSHSSLYINSYEITATKGRGRVSTGCGNTVLTKRRQWDEKSMGNEELLHDLPTSKAHVTCKTFEGFYIRVYSNQVACQ
jgi:hypothetical protein